MVHGLLEVWHELLVRSRHQIWVRIRVNHVLWHLARMHREHRHRHGHRPSLESDVRSAIGSCTILKGRWLEDYALAIAFAVSLGFDAVFAYWAFLAALDATFSTCQTSSLSSFAREFSLQRSLSLAGVSAVQRVLVVAIIVRRLVSSSRVHLAGSLSQKRKASVAGACFGRVETLRRSDPKSCLGRRVVQAETSVCVPSLGQIRTQCRQ